MTKDIKKAPNSTWNAEAAQAIASKYGFDIKASNFEWWLFKASHYFKTYDTQQSAIQNSKNQKELLLKISETSQLLSTLLEKNDPWELAIEFENACSKRHDTPLGQSFDDLKSDLKALADTTARLHKKAPQNPGGRPSVQGLKRAAGYIGDFWERELGRRFTIDYHKGAGLTEAINFFSDVIALFGNVPHSRLITAMRHDISERATHINRPVKS